MAEQIILGIESSCDDTAAALVRGDGTVLASIVMGQNALHEGFGGVVPEIAARAHAERLDLATIAALKEAGLSLDDVDALAVTAGPGLIGGVLSGVMFAKGLAAASGKPLVAVNHLAGHALTPRLTHRLGYPYLMLLVSGGHCQFIAVEGPEMFHRLGGTIDDAPGEAFDKVARLLGLGYPGGPLVEAAAKVGDATRFKLPRPLAERAGCDMSFSGLKTAVRRLREKLEVAQGGLYSQDIADICAGFQAAVADSLAGKTRAALQDFEQRFGSAKRLAVAGGVAANATIRAAIGTVAAEIGARLVLPPMGLCTDNAAMIAWAGHEQLALRGPDGLAFSARPRWPLDAAATPMLGYGKKGPKA
ncbi:MAG: tRNA (adenosine(37)-N6)-threonylcarbamoyltransferase complex transferase subunit TsaD [Paracoccaceae bacterium]